MLKKVALITVAVPLALVLTACSGSNAPSNQDNQSIDSGGREQVDKAQENIKKSDADLLAEYSNAMQSLDMSMITDDLDSMIDSLNEPGECAKLASDVDERCDKFIYFDNVPEIAERAHSHTVEAMLKYKECAEDYLRASRAKDVDSFTKYVNAGTAAMRDSTDCLNSAADAMGEAVSLSKSNQP